MKKLYAVVVAFCITLSVKGQVELVKDLNPGEAVPALIGGCVYQGFIYYQGGTELNGFELWRTDGTAENSTLVKDIYHGNNNNSSFPGGFVVLNNLLYFSATNEQGRELWRTDGTAEGTVMVADINPGSASSNPKEFTVFGNKLFFRATHPAYGTEIWQTDGTASGTLLLNDANPGTGSSNFLYSTGTTFLAYDGSLYFSADDGGPGAELWKTDGTIGGTLLFKQFYDTVQSSTVSFLVEVNSRLMIGVLNDHKVKAWMSDGTTEGTHPLGDVTVSGPGGVYPDRDQIIGQYLYFSGASGESQNYEVWKTDGTLANTMQVVDINGDPEVESLPCNFLAIDSVLYFDAVTATANVYSVPHNLYKTNGDVGNYYLIKDDFKVGYAPMNLTNYRGMLVFAGESEFYWCDGNTVNMVEAGMYGNPDGNYLIELNDILYFSPSGLRTFDGTTVGMVGSGAYHSSNPASFTYAGNGVTYFSADDGVNGFELWKTTGTASGTVLVKNINAAGGSNPTQLIVGNGTLYFTADDGVHGIEVWKSNGTEDGTLLVADLSPGPSSSVAHSLTVRGDTLFVVTSTGLWEIVNAQSPLLLTNATVTKGTLIASGHYLFFMAWDPVTMKCSLFKSDWTQTGTVVVTNNLAGCVGPSTAFSELVAFNSKIYFQAYNQDFRTELWVYDGATSFPVKTFSQGGPELAGNFTVIGNTLFFGASDATHGYEMWKTDGSAANTVMIKDSRPGTSSSLYTPQPHGPPLHPGFQRAALNGRLYFTADDGIHGFELWTTDGTDEGTYLLNDLVTGVSSANPIDFEILGSALYFVAEEEEFDTSSRQLFVTYGESCGTHRISSVDDGLNSAKNLSVSGTRLYGSLKLLKLGQEPFIVDPSQIPSPPPGCGPPQPQPLSHPPDLTFSSVTNSSIAGSFTPSANPGAGYVTLMRAYDSPYPDEVPVDGVTYEVGDVIGSSTIVVTVGTQNTFGADYLNANTVYYFAVFAYNADHNYLTSDPIEGHQQTLDNSGRMSSGLTFFDVTDSSLTLSFSGIQPVPEGYLTLMQGFSSPYPNAVPQDGVVYHVGDLVGNSSIVVGTGAETELSVIYLAADTEYFFDVYPYNDNHYDLSKRINGRQRTLPSSGMSQQSPYPNPFTESITIPFTTEGSTNVQVTIYDQLGTVVANLTDESFDAGAHEAIWNGVDISGNKCQSGLYIYSIRSSNGGTTRGTLLAK